MADIIYSTACSIPSPKDLYNLPLSLFTNSIMSCSLELFDKMDQNNYQSYIVAIAKYADKNLPSSDETISKISEAAELLAKTIKKKGIVLHPLESLTVDLLCHPNSDSFSNFYNCFPLLKTLI